MVASMVPASVAVQAAEGDTIRLVNGKVEVDAQFEKNWLRCTKKKQEQR